MVLEERPSGSASMFLDCLIPQRLQGCFEGVAFFGGEVGQDLTKGLHLPGLPVSFLTSLREGHPYQVLSFQVLGFSQ